MLLAGFMTYPLYIVNMAFILENTDDISIINYIQLTSSFIVLCISPFANLLSLIKLEYLSFGLVLTIRDKIRIFIVLCWLFVPLMAIEIIHFFPLLCAYYIDGIINFEQLWILLLIFNIPKLLIIIHVFKLISKSSNFQFCDRSKHDDADIGFCLCCCCLSLNKIVMFSLAMFIVLPLIPYAMLMLRKNCAVQTQLQKFKNGTNKCKWIFSQYYFESGKGVTSYYLILSLYLLLAYGISSIVLLYFGYSNSNGQISNLLIILIAIVLFLVLFLVVSMPFTIFQIKKYVPYLNSTVENITKIFDEKMNFHACCCDKICDATDCCDA